MGKKDYKTENMLFYDKRYIKASYFSEKYNISRYQISMHVYSNHKFIKKWNGILYINEHALIRRREFYIDVWNRCHSNFFSITEHISENKLSEIMSKHFNGSLGDWNQFFMYRLFSPSFMEKSILLYKINDKLWAFFRASTFIIRRLLRYEDLVSEGKMRRIKSGRIKRKK